MEGGLNGRGPERMVFSTSYEVLGDGGTKVVVATPEDGEIFSVRFDREDSIANVVAWAAALGLVVHPA